MHWIPELTEAMVPAHLQKACVWNIQVRGRILKEDYRSGQQKGLLEEVESENPVRLKALPKASLSHMGDGIVGKCGRAAPSSSVLRPINTVVGDTHCHLLSTGSTPSTPNFRIDTIPLILYDMSSVDNVMDMLLEKLHKLDLPLFSRPS